MSPIKARLPTDMRQFTRFLPAASLVVLLPSSAACADIAPLCCYCSLMSATTASLLVHPLPLLLACSLLVLPGAGAGAAEAGSAAGCWLLDATVTDDSVCRDF